MVNEITSFQGKYSAEIIKEGLFDSIMWPYLGKLKARPGKIQALQYKGITPYKQRTKDDTTI